MASKRSSKTQERFRETLTDASKVDELFLNEGRSRIESRDVFEDIKELVKTIPGAFKSLVNNIHKVKPILSREPCDNITEFQAKFSYYKKDIESDVARIVSVFQGKDRLCLTADHHGGNYGMCRYRTSIRIKVAEQPLIVRELFFPEKYMNSCNWSKGVFLDFWPLILDVIMLDLQLLEGKVRLADDVVRVEHLWQEAAVDIQLFWGYARQIDWSFSDVQDGTCSYRRVWKNVKEILPNAQEMDSSKGKLDASDIYSCDESLSESKVDSMTEAKVQGGQVNVVESSKGHTVAGQINRGLAPKAAPRQCNMKKLKGKETETKPEFEHRTAESNDVKLSVKGPKASRDEEVNDPEERNGNPDFEDGRISEERVRINDKNDKEDLHRLEKRISHLQAQCEGLTDKNARLVTQKTTTENEVRRLKEELQRLQAQNEQLTRDIGRLSKEKTDAEGKIRQLGGEVDDLQAEYKRVMGKKQDRDRKAKEVNTLKEECERLERKTEDQEREMQQFKKQVAESNAECTRLGSRNKALKNDKDNLKDAVDVWMKQCHDLVQDCKACSNKLGAVVRQNESLQRENDRLESLCRGVTKTRRDRPRTSHGERSYDRETKTLTRRQEERIQELVLENKQLRSGHDTLLNSMAAKMNSELSRDESSLENVSNKNRPMKILEEYQLFCSSEWLEAKNAIDELVASRELQINERKRCQVLISGMEKCYETMQNAYDNTRAQMATAVTTVVDRTVFEIASFGGVQDGDTDKAGTGFQEAFDRTGSTDWKSARRSSPVTSDQCTVGGGMQKSTREQTALDRDLEVTVARLLKERCDDVDFAKAAKEISVSLFPHETSPLRRKDAILQFLTKSLSMSWKMVLQQPSMRFCCDAGPDRKFVGKKHEPHYASANPADPDAVIQYFVHPMLMQGEKQMCKARVFLHIPRG